MSAILLDQEIVHYEVLGRGRPIIFLHGWVGSWRYWIPVMQATSISYRAYALDLWGFGDTAKDPARYSLPGQLRLLDAFLEQMGILRFAVVGHGLGAILALLYAQQNPDQVDRILAVGYPMDEALINPRLRSDSPADLADWLLNPLPVAEPARIDAPKTDAQVVQASLASLSENAKHLNELWRNTRPACLLVHGQNDPVIHLPGGDELENLPEHVHSIVFEQSGHFPMLDETNKFNRLVVDFLSLASGDSPRELQLKDEWRRRVR
jgi:pimeloyl-ACP methyl ester carboxylesterase